MSFNHVVVWLDHSEAHVLHFSADATDKKTISAHSEHKQLHTKSGKPGSGHSPEDKKYYHAVARALADTPEILITGPANAKLELMKHLQSHDPAVAGKVVGVESVDHPSDGQLLAFAREYFVKADQLRGDTVHHVA